MDDLRSDQRFKICCDESDCHRMIERRSTQEQQRRIYRLACSARPGCGNLGPAWELLAGVRMWGFAHLVARQREA
jgi:hypothetical protein